MRRRVWGTISVAVVMVLAACANDGTENAAGDPPAAGVAAPTTPPARALDTTVAAPASTDAQTTTSLAADTTTTVADQPMRAGAQRLHFEVGPINIEPGQNNIDFQAGIPQP